MSISKQVGEVLLMYVRYKPLEEWETKFHDNIYRKMDSTIVIQGYIHALAMLKCSVIKVNNAKTPLAPSVISVLYCYVRTCSRKADSHVRNVFLYREVDMVRLC